ncbi:hypothetical protein DM02DRAFT_689382 [Periconia macrospinosa]|uniref:Saccharopine dehydrogenase NADP binding domain-containing protein n=1 Tax=Periconia macrospinosa TaxID=97972 RepID=A0A2V1DDU3_9PLEO|nr:hypothetical protein DM02DRAFT_689382 [Periconia macrospinosa]
MPKLLIYGATGYTGRMVTQNARDLGLDLMISGRTSSTSTEKFASELGVPYCLFDINQNEVIDTILASVSVLLNCAGPFFRTAEQLMSACIRNRTHYLDISAELGTYKMAEESDQEAKDAGVMLLPGCGGSVVMLGCLAGHALKRVENPVSVDVALYVAGSMSRGSAISASESLRVECLQRLDGKLVAQKATDAMQFDFDNGQGCVTTYPVTLPDLITIWKSTKIPNISTYVHVAGDAFPTGDLGDMPFGPTKEEREATPYHAAVKVLAEDRKNVTCAVLHSKNGYTFTGLASVEAVSKVLRGSVKAGFQTPTLVFGNDFVETIADSCIKNL